MWMRISSDPSTTSRTRLAGVRTFSVENSNDPSVGSWVTVAPNTASITSSFVSIRVSESCGDSSAGVRMVRTAALFCQARIASESPAPGMVSVMPSSET